jgi:hypothetical protein
MNYDVRFKVFMVMTVKNIVFWDVAPRATWCYIPEDDILHELFYNPISICNYLASGDRMIVV